MNTYLDCLPCFMYQALRAGRIATNDEKKNKRLLDKIGTMIKDIPLQNTPPETGAIIYKTVRDISGINDPYKKIKELDIKNAKALYPEMKDIVSKSDNRLLTAIRLAIAGNVIDRGVKREYNIVDDVNRILKQPFAVLDFEGFNKQLKKAKSILFLGDNAGESVFDKILIEELRKPVIYVVRGEPVINDVTFQDAFSSGLGEVAEIISSGCSAPGTVISICHDKFVEKFNHADMVISKGQGNYEGLSNSNRSVFFLLTAKCHVIARNLNVNQGDIVLKESQKYKRVIN